MTTCSIRSRRRKVKEVLEPNKAAGGVLTAKQAPAGPAPPRRPVSAPGSCAAILSQTNFEWENRPMLLHSWLQRPRSTLAPRQGQRHHPRRGCLRAATRWLNVEVLEDRALPSLNYAGSFPVGNLPQAVVTADFNNDGH